MRRSGILPRVTIAAVALALTACLADRATAPRSPSIPSLDVVATDVTQAFPANIPTCDANLIAAAEQAGRIVALPGKPNEKGILLATQQDIAGNTIEVWCLKARERVHGGPDLGYLFTPKGAAEGVWIGACTLVTGQNYFTLRVDEIVNGTGGQLFFNKFTGFSWKNFEKDDGTANAKKDFEYDYVVATGKLTITRTQGAYKDTTAANGTKIRIYRSMVVETQKGGPINAPKNFEDLKLNGTQITLNSGRGGVANEGVGLAMNADRAGLLRFSLSGTALGGLGTVAAPFTGAPFQIRAGDVLTIGGTALHDPAVAGNAALASFGGWVAGAVTATSVSFVATADALLLPGLGIDGFEVGSPSRPSSVPWFYAGEEQFSNAAGVIAH
jgi:hypothetical protein